MNTRDWLIDILIGGVLGAITGAIVAVNVVIFAGIEEGYEASIPDVFRQNTIVGVATVGILLTGPIVGVVVRRRMRDRSE